MLHNFRANGSVSCLLRACDTSSFIYGSLLVQGLRLVWILGGTVFCTGDINSVWHVGVTTLLVYPTCP
jgi:hypothetical protein